VYRKHAGFLLLTGEGRVVRKPCESSGQWIQKHAGFVPAITRRGNSFAFPLPTVASIPSRLPASPSRACALRPRGHIPSAPPTDLWLATNQQSLLGSRLRSPLPSVEEPCPLSLQTVFSPTDLRLIIDCLGQKQRAFEPLCLSHSNGFLNTLPSPKRGWNSIKILRFNWI